MVRMPAIEFKNSYVSVTSGKRDWVWRLSLLPVECRESLSTFLGTRYQVRTCTRVLVLDVRFQGTSTTRYKYNLVGAMNTIAVHMFTSWNLGITPSSTRSIHVLRKNHHGRGGAPGTGLPYCRIALQYSYCRTVIRGLVLDNRVRHTPVDGTCIS